MKIEGEITKTENDKRIWYITYCEYEYLYMYCMNVMRRLVIYYLKKKYTNKLPGIIIEQQEAKVYIQYYLLAYWHINIKIPAYQARQAYTVQ